MEDPRNLIPMQTSAEMSGSQIKRLTKDMIKMALIKTTL